MIFISYEFHTIKIITHEVQSVLDLEVNMRAGIIALVLLTAFSYASDPRLTVLTGDARLLLNDFNEMWAFPGTISKYQFCSISSIAVEGMGDSGEKWKLGWFGGVTNSGGTSWGAVYNHDKHILEVLYNPGSFGIIAGVDYIKNETTNYGPLECIKDQYSFSTSFGTGLAFPFEYSDISLGAEYFSVKYSSAETSTKTTELQFNTSLRGHTDHAFFNLFPVISAEFSRLDIQDSIIVTTISADLGIAVNRMISPETRLIAGAFIGVNNSSPEDGDDALTLDLIHIKAGIEQRINSWLFLRAGAISITNRFKDGEKDAVVTTRISSRFGLGFEIFNFSLDAGISEGFLHNGPYMISGNSEGFLGSLSCTYYF